MKFVVTAIFSLLFLVTKAQNLVPNPSFEDSVSCPSLGLITAKDWYSSRASPDYFHRCASDDASVPFAGFGTQSPFPSVSGNNAYVGFITYCGATDTYRELVGCHLVDSMVVGITYYVSFKIALAELSTFATNKIGVTFYTVQHLVDTLVNQPAPISNIAHVWTDAIFSDTSWATFSGQFIADSAYGFMTIGNFFDSNQTTAIEFPEQGVFCAYYFIDDVCVSADSLYCDLNTSGGTVLVNAEAKIYPSPFTKQVNLAIPNKARIKVTNVFGQIVYESTIEPSLGEFKIDFSNIPSGVYCVTVDSNNQRFTQKVVKQ